MRSNLLWLALGLLVSVALGLSANLITGSGSSAQAAQWSGVVVGLLGSALGALLWFRAEPQVARRRESDFADASPAPSHYSASTSTSAPTSADPRLLQLIRNISQIEYLAATQLLQADTGGRRTSIFRLRAELLERGIWSDDDVKAFDRAFSIRNAFVHADELRCTDAELEASIRDTHHLLREIKLAVSN